MIISVCGYNYSGSSAVVDLLMEYENIGYIEDEIGFPYLPDGLTDLEHHVNNASTYFNGDVAICRYYNICKRSAIPQRYRRRFLGLTRKYINKLIDLEWIGNSSFDGSRKYGASYYVWRMKRLISSVVYHYSKKVIPFDQRIMYLAYDNPSFAEHTKWYYREIEQLFADGNEFVVLNQFFSAFQPERSMNHADNAKTLVVDRDPRDIYILGKVRHECSCYPVDDVKKFVIWYKKCHKEKVLTNTERVMHVRFEDLIFDYDATVKNIESFIGLGKHLNKQKRFKPEISKNNTQLVNRFPNLEEDVKYIVEQLPQNIYQFPDNYIIEGTFF